MKKLYSQLDYQQKSDEANANGQFLYILEKQIEENTKVLEWEKKEISIPILDENGEETGETKTVNIDDYKKPIMENSYYVDEITGKKKKIQIQKSHIEVKNVVVQELVIADVGYYICQKDNITDGTLNPNYNIDKRAFLDNLKLTSSDVERALYYGLGMDFEDLQNHIKKNAPNVDSKGLAIEFRAKDFYRGAVDKNGNRIIDFVGNLLGFNSNDMDYLFLHKKLPVKEEN